MKTDSQGSSLRVRFWLVGGLRTSAFARAWGIGGEVAYNTEKLLIHWNVTDAKAIEKFVSQKT